MNVPGESAAAEPSLYEVREFYSRYMLWISLFLFLNVIFNIFFDHKVIKFILLGCILVAGIVSIVKTVKSMKKIMKLSLYSDRIIIDEMNLHANELKSVTLYQGSAMIDFVKKEGSLLSKGIRVMLINMEEKPDIHRQLTMFCTNNGITLTRF